MKALKFFGPEDIRIADVEVPKLRKGEVLVKVIACGICGSDIKIKYGKKKAKKGVTLGHEISGIVVESKSKSIKPGTTVSIYPSRICKRCYPCSKGLYNLCHRKKSLGYILDGGFSEFVRIPEEIVAIGGLINLEGIDPIVGALTEPLGCVVNSLEILLKDTETLLVVGGGALGLMHIALASKVINVDLVEPNTTRGLIGKKLGANRIYKDISEVNLRYDSIALCAPIYNKVDQLINMLNERGKINIFAGSKEAIVNVKVRSFHYSERIITGTHSTTPSKMNAARDFLVENQDKLKEIVTHIFPLSKWEEAFKTYEEKIGIKVIIKPD